MRNKKHQIIFIHGGMTFEKEKEYLDFLKNRPISPEGKRYWSGDDFAKNLGRNFEIIRPQMPLKENARYKDWKIHFERFFPFIGGGGKLILIGASLGGIFLARYLSENKFPKRVFSLYLIAAPYDDDLPDEGLCNGFRLKSDLSLLSKSAKHINLVFGKDDEVVPLEHGLKYAAKLPSARLIILKNTKGHFRLKKFPALAKMIKEEIKK